VDVLAGDIVDWLIGDKSGEAAEVEIVVGDGIGAEVAASGYPVAVESGGELHGGSFLSVLTSSAVGVIVRVIILTDRLSIDSTAEV